MKNIRGERTIITISQASKIAGNHPETVRNWILKGAKFSRKPHGRTWMIDEASFRHWLKHERAAFTNPRTRKLRRYPAKGRKKKTSSVKLGDVKEYIYLPAGAGKGKIRKRYE